MDLQGERYDTLDELRTYCYRVASVVGMWLTELFGVHDSVTLDHAARLGHAMQLTNIVRDVGEDWAAGRLYLPRDLMRRQGLTTRTIERVRRSGERVPEEYRAVLEELMVVAEADYRAAWQGILALPEFLRPAVAVASRVYAAIHDAVRENGYDTLRRRAMTSPGRKLALARGALRDLGAPGAALDVGMSNASSRP
jgi:phytoene synthase